MSSVLEMRSRLQLTLEGIEPPVGRVHPYSRYTAETQQLKSLFQDADGAFRGWTITCEASPESAETNSQTERGYRWVIRGYLGWQDSLESEVTFQQLAESVCDALRADIDLGGLSARDCDPPAVRLFDPRMFAGVLCHYCEIVITSWATKEVGRASG